MVLHGQRAIRSIGLMSHDFWQPPHLGGTDSLGINSISIDGFNLAAIKALEQQTAELKEKREEVTHLRSVLAEQQELIAAMKRDSDSRYSELVKLIRTLQPEQRGQDQHQVMLLDKEGCQSRIRNAHTR
jgi:hypothetical protein